MHSLFTITKLFLKISARNHPVFPRRHRRSVVSSHVHRNALLILCFPVTNSNDWLVKRMIYVISLLKLFYSRDLILCCKLLCSNYGGYLNVDIMTSQMSIPMPINNELSCLHWQFGSALLQMCHGRERSTPSSRNGNDYFYLLLIGISWWNIMCYLMRLLCLSL